MVEGDARCPTCGRARDAPRDARMGGRIVTHRECNPCGSRWAYLLSMTDPNNSNRLPVNLIGRS